MFRRNSSSSTSRLRAICARSPCRDPGEFSVRGGIVDVFSPLMRTPVRMEFFGDTVDSIREFDLDDQRSRGPVQHIDILPMQDVLVTREMIRAMGRNGARSTGTDESFKRISPKNSSSPKAENCSPARRSCLPLAFPLESTIFDYADGAVLVLDEPESSARNTREVSGERFSNASSKPFRRAAWPCLRRILFWSPEDLGRPRIRNPRLHLEELGTAEFPNAVVFPVRSQPSARWHGRIKELAEEVREAYSNGTQVVLLGSTLGMAERLRDFLHEYDIPVSAGVRRATAEESSMIRWPRSSASAGFPRD